MIISCLVCASVAILVDMVAVPAVHVFSTAFPLLALNVAIR